MIQNSGPLSAKDLYLTQRYQLWQDKVLHPEYMGATEFETGGVRQALAVLGGTLLDNQELNDKNLILVQDHKWYELRVYSTPEVEVPDRLVLDKAYFKEGLRLEKEWIGGKTKDPMDITQCWLPIQFYLRTGKPMQTHGRGVIMFRNEPAIAKAVEALLKDGKAYADKIRSEK